MSLTLIREKKTDYSIIISGHAAACERKAAAELSAYLEKISGVKLRCFADDTPEKPCEIVLGRTNRETPGQFDREALGMNGFTIRTEGENLFLVGGDAYGTLYAAYEFLEKYLGCRFYTSTFEKVPQKETVALPPIDDTQRPGFAYRSIHWYAYMQSDGLCAKRKVNYRRVGNPLPEEYGMQVHFCKKCACHTIYDLAEMTGKSIDIQPCLSDEKVYQTVLKNMRKFLQADPTAAIISVGQNDTHRWSAGCTCDKCRQVLEETGSYAGSWIKLINRLAEELEAEYPDLLYHTFAYRFTRQPPENITLHKNILVELCTIESCFRHPLAECGTVGDDHIPAENFPVLIEKWAKIAPRLAIWDYTTNFKNYSMTHPNLGVLRKNARLFAEHGASYIFEQGNSGSQSGEFGDLRGYLLTKLMWDPYMSEEEYRRITEEFIDDFYGQGAPFIKEYIRLGMDYTADKHVTTYELQPEEFPNTPTAEGELIPHPIITEGERLFAAALEAESDPILRKNIECASIQIGHLKSLYGFERLALARAALEDRIKAAEPHMTEKELNRTVNDALKEDYDRYRAENRALAEKMHRHKVYAATESVGIKDLETLNFDRPITQWGNPDHVIPV